MTPTPHAGIPPAAAEWAELRRLATADRITEGPWFTQPSERLPADGVVYGPDGDSFATIAWNPGNDYDPVATAALIAFLSPDRVLRLLAERERLREALATAADWFADRGWGVTAGDIRALLAVAPEPPETVEEGT